MRGLCYTSARMNNDEVLALEQRVTELSKLYENYFAGIERLEPLKKRERLVAELRRIVADGTQANTQVQFRFNNLRARLATLESHWNRIVKALEEGRLRRGNIHAASPAPSLTTSGTVPIVQQAAAPPPQPSGLEDTTMRALYDKYAKSRASTGEAPVSYDSMVASLKKQVPAVIERFKCKGVDFKVAQKDGKTIIKAVPIQ